MSKKARRAVVIFFGILAAIIIVGVIVLGTNKYKNRWHKIDFQIQNVTVTENTDEDPEHKGYLVTVNGTAQNWFYDFNTYQFNFTDNQESKPVLSNIDYSGTLTVNHKDKTDFKISFYVDSIENIRYFVFAGTNIYINDESKNDADIRLFMCDYEDVIPTTE